MGPQNKKLKNGHSPLTTPADFYPSMGWLGPIVEAAHGWSPATASHASGWSSGTASPPSGGLHGLSVSLSSQPRRFNGYRCRARCCSVHS
jgi:hypothetical protein